MRKKIAAGNWKMNLKIDEANHLVNNILSRELPTDVEVIFGVPHVYLHDMMHLVNATENVVVSAQNCHHMTNGAYTGEISIDMLESISIDHVIVGHSERRELFGESDAVIKQKVDLLIEKDCRPIFCCGEPLEVRENQGQNAYVKNQLINSLFHLDHESFKNVIIAYEPIWAIGTGKTASAEQAQEMHFFIRKLIAENYNVDLADGISILYGGSVKPDNAKELFSQKDVDGGLVGGASLNADDFYHIICSF